ncbi:hypothetical protein E2C01_023050 [Portunus trituberculatus]|uniref:Uncharacterized protein n=1 Tax=Portunus trituberculatus TaxID=210409 RepID=A0A5B7E8Q3_PORTR|nr:hypothetical protein [Portunus trituberculatus]
MEKIFPVHFLPQTFRDTHGWKLHWYERAQAKDNKNSEKQMPDENANFKRKTFDLWFSKYGVCFGSIHLAAPPSSVSPSIYGIQIQENPMAPSSPCTNV